MNPAARSAPAWPTSLKTGAGLGAFAAVLLVSGLVLARQAGLLAAFYLFGTALIVVPLLLLALVVLAVGVAEHRRNCRNAGSAPGPEPTSFGNEQ